jgi:hypothetical protein
MIMKLIICKQILFLILFAAVFSMAEDGTSDQFDDFTDDSVLVNQGSLVNQNVSDAQSFPDEQSVPVNQAVSKPTKSSIANVDFAPVSAENKKNGGAIIDVDFGQKGDAQYTAVKTGDDSYKVEKKNKASGYFIAFGCIIASLIIFALVI